MNCNVMLYAPNMPYAMLHADADAYAKLQLHDL